MAFQPFCVLAAAGFYHSNFFPYERPFANDYPSDTLASYRNMYRTAILDPSLVVLVAEDTLNKSETSSVYDALAKVYPPWDDQIPPEYLDEGKAIVGVTSLSLQSGSERKGQWQPDGSGPKDPNDPDLRDRDKNPVAGKLLDNELHNKTDELFKGRMETDTLVVHPAYWRKGHGTSLNKWHTELADLDGVGLGVVASKMGRKLFTHVGFKEAAQINVPGYENHPKPLEVWIGLRNLSETQPKAEL